MSLPWDNNSWHVAAQIAARGRQNAAAWVAATTANNITGQWLGPIMASRDTPLVLRDAAAREADAQETAAQRPQLLIQTAIVPDQKADKGSLILAVAVPWFDIIDQIGRDPNAAYQIPPEKWEEIVAGAYQTAGFDEVILTPRSGDYGRDVIATKKGLGHVRVIDQVKAFKPDHLVNANDVRALMGVLQADGASKGFLTTTSDFAPMIRTDPLITPLIPKQLELINGESLFAGLKELAQKRPKSN
jgi:restriction system protein